MRDYFARSPSMHMLRGSLDRLELVGCETCGAVILDSYVSEHGEFHAALSNLGALAYQLADSAEDRSQEELETRLRSILDGRDE